MCRYTCRPLTKTMSPSPVSRTTERSGKIYAFGNYIFQNDLNKGIHLIDNTDPLHLQKIAFLNIPYNTEFAVKGNYIYANNGNDLVVVDVRDVNASRSSKANGGCLSLC